MRNCEECGTRNPDDALYCSSCGHSLPPSGRWTSTYTPSYTSTSSGLFSNAGPKLKVLAKVLFALLLIAGEILGILSIKTGSDKYYGGEMFFTIGIVLVIATPLIAWLSSIMLYAFGELCENIDRIRQNTSEVK